MELEILDAALSICKPARWVDWSDAAQGLFFLARTDEELSLVCPSDKVPADCLAREDGFRACASGDRWIFPWWGYCPACCVPWRNGG